MNRKGTNKDNFWKLIAGYFGYIMVLFYLVLGLGFIFTNVFGEFFSSEVLRLLLGILLILYSVFRGYRVFKQIKDQKDDKK